MKDFPLDDDPLLAAALEEFRQAPSGDAPARVLVSLIEKQVAARRRPGSGRVWAVAAVAIVALIAGFWAGRSSRSDAKPFENRIAAPPELPEPPRIPFAAA